MNKKLLIGVFVVLLALFVSSMAFALGGTSGTGSGTSLTASGGGAPNVSNATGTLPVANGGTGSTTAFTQGSVVFTGAAGVYTQDNANFFYDATNHRLGLGAVSPTNILSLGGQSAQTIWMERDVTAATAGQNLTLQAGGAVSAGTNLAGGDAIISSGISTGTGTSNIKFNIFPAGSTGTADNAATTKAILATNGGLSIGTATANAPANGAWIQGSTIIGGITPSTTHVLDVTGAAGVLMSVGNTIASGDPVFYFQTANSEGAIITRSNHPMSFGTNNSPDKLVITTGGNVGIGTSTVRNSANLDVQGNLNVNGTTINAPNLGTSSAATTGTVCWTTGTGLFNIDTTVACLASLEELKDIQHPITGALDIVNKINPFWFKWKKTVPEYAGDKHEQPGMGAHQVEGVDKRLVAYSPNGKLKGVRYQEMTAVLVEAVKELKTANDNQQREIDELKQQKGK